MKKPSASIGKKRGKRAEVADWIAARQGAEIGKAEFEQLRRDLAPVSENYLRKLLRESGAPLSAMVEGVRQGSFDELESSLLRMLDEYERGNQRVREVVIAAKDRAQWAAKNPDRRVEKEEVVLWMMTWLENPPVFPTWVKLRRGVS